MKLFRFLMILPLILIFFPGNVLSYHPLITDDTGTQGKGRFQLEITGEYGYDKEDGITTETTEIAGTLTYGIVDTVDITIGIPYMFIEEKDGFPTTKKDGVSDISIDLKWRFMEKYNLSLALKPGVTLPAGDEEKGLGSGKVTYGLFLIATEELKPFQIHVNLGYLKNSNKLYERTDIWHASIAGDLEVLKNLKVAVNTGIETNPDRSSSTHPVFILGGIIYAVNEDLDVDIGVKTGINKPETDTSVLGGITLRF